MSRNGARGQAEWQLDMLRFSLKKRQKLELLVQLLGHPATGRRCLLITNGDNTGSLNYRLRELGGSWCWAEIEESGIAAMEALLAEPVHRVEPGRLPFDDDCFDRIVVIDVHEHLADVAPFNREIARVLAPQGLAVVTTPNGDRRLAVAVLKRWIGMNEAAYGHVVQGYRTEELEMMLQEVGLEPAARGWYARFFTELIELAINFGYVKLLSRGARGRGARNGGIAPRTQADLGSVRKSYRLYRVLFPFLRAVASLDRLVPGRGGYAVAVAARKPG